MDFLASIATKEMNNKEMGSVEKNNISEVKEMPLCEKLTNAATLEPGNKESLSLYEKTVVKIEQPDWSLETIGYIDSMEEYTVYKEAELEQKQVGDKIGLIRNDIDFEQKDEFGRTNVQRIEANLSPINKQGETVELHHVGQKPDSPLAELSREEHRGVGNDTILHDKNIKSEIDRAEFQKEKIEYWNARKEMEV